MRLLYIAIVVAICLAIWYGPNWVGWTIFGLTLLGLIYVMYTMVKDYFFIAESIAESIIEGAGCCAQASPKSHSETD